METLAYVFQGPDPANDDERDTQSLGRLRYHFQIESFSSAIAVNGGEKDFANPEVFQSH
jgi:hypothetical protein